MNYRVAYDRFILRAIRKNFENGIKVNPTINCDRPNGMEIHHIVPKILGGTNKSSNLVLMSTTDHVYAHILLNLALLQEQKYQDLDKLSYHSFNGNSKDIFSQNAIKNLKVLVGIEGKKHMLVLGIVEAAKYFCFGHRQNYMRNDNLYVMARKILHTGIFRKSNCGIPIRIKL